MKIELIKLIEEIDIIETYFSYDYDEMFGGNIIYNKIEFINWKQELIFELGILYKKDNDEFINKIIIFLDSKLNGWSDKEDFNELKGKLNALKKNIDRYYPNENGDELLMGGNREMTRETKLFISHSSKDEGYIRKIVRLLENIGLRDKHLFCSSVEGYGIPLGEDIYDYLRDQFSNHNLHMIFALSDNYYKSVPCLNEMGAAWVLKTGYTTILLPGFEFKEIDGAINPRRIGLKFAENNRDLKEKLNQFKDFLIREFKLENLADIRWEEIRDDFIDDVSSNKGTNKYSI